jgi:hypothetical protein
MMAGCSPTAMVETYSPLGLDRSKPIAVAFPGGRIFALDPNRLQQEIANGLRRAGFGSVTQLPGTRTHDARFELVATVSSELLVHPLEDSRGESDPYYSSFGGERVRVVLEITDSSQVVVYRAIQIEGVSSALTEARAAEALLRPLADGAGAAD